MLKKKFLISSLSLLTILLVLLISCNKEDFSNVGSERPSLSPELSWLYQGDLLTRQQSQIFILSQRPPGGSPAIPSEFRIYGTFKNPTTGEFNPITSVRIGEVVIPQLRQDEVMEGADPTGQFHRLFSNNINEEDFQKLLSYEGQMPEVIIESNGVAYNPTTAQIVNTLAISLTDGKGRNALAGPGLDKSTSLTFSWPIPSEFVNFRDGTEEHIGATLVYQPGYSEMVTGLTTLPTETISIEKTGLVTDGSISFDASDLSVFPTEGYVTVYIGHLRYTFNSDGELEYDPHTPVVVSGGGGGVGPRRVFDDIP